MTENLDVAEAYGWLLRADLNEDYGIYLDGFGDYRVGRVMKGRRTLALWEVSKFLPDNNVS